MSHCLSFNGISNLADITHSTRFGAIDATVISNRIGNDFGFKPIVAGIGILIDEVTNPGSITVTATGVTTTLTLQNAYQGGQVVNLNSGPIIINGNSSVDINATEGINNFGNESFTNQYIADSINISDGDSIFIWPPPFVTLPFNSFSYLEVEFLGYNIANQNDIFSIVSKVRYDPTNLGNEVTHTNVNMSITNSTISPGFMAGVDFIFNHPNPANIYNVSYNVHSFTKSR